MVVKLNFSSGVFSDFLTCSHLPNLQLASHYMLLKWPVFPIISGTGYPNSRSSCYFASSSHRFQGVGAAWHLFLHKRKKTFLVSPFPVTLEGKVQPCKKSSLRSTCSIMCAHRKCMSSLSVGKTIHLRAPQLTAQYLGIQLGTSCCVSHPLQPLILCYISNHHVLRLCLQEPSPLPWKSL